jgi:hypothetical protein
MVNISHAISEPQEGQTLTKHPGTGLLTPKTRSNDASLVLKKQQETRIGIIETDKNTTSSPCFHSLSR